MVDNWRRLQALLENQSDGVDFLKIQRLGVWEAVLCWRDASHNAHSELASAIGNTVEEAVLNVLDKYERQKERK